MNALLWLQSEHRRISDALVQMQGIQGYETKRSRFAEARRDLERHIEIEEAELYSALSERSGFEDLMEEAYDDHQEIRDLIGELSSVTTEESFDDLLEDLIASVEHHVEEEEGELFPKVDASLSIEELERIGDRMSRARETPAAA